MKFRKSKENDVKGIIEIIKQAQEYFKNNKINQWQNNYPNVETIYKDIKDKSSYVLLYDEQIVGTAVISFEEEKTYDEIYEGDWLSNEEYAVVHRVAIHNEYKGRRLVKRIFEEVERLCLEKGVYSIKIDTHEENLAMQNVLNKNGFVYCGVIYLEDGSKRIAFEKRIVDVI